MDWTSEWYEILKKFGTALGYKVQREYPTPLRGRIDLAWLISNSEDNETTGLIGLRPEITFELESLTAGITLRQRKINLFKCLEFDPMLRPRCHVQIIREKEYHFVPEGMGVRTKILYDDSDYEKEELLRNLLVSLWGQIGPSIFTTGFKERLKSVGFKSIVSILHVGGDTSNHTSLDSILRSLSNSEELFLVEGYPLDKITLLGMGVYDPIFPENLDVFDLIVVSKVGKVTDEKRTIANTILEFISSGIPCFFFADKGIFHLFRQILPIIPDSKGRTADSDFKDIELTSNLDITFGIHLRSLGKVNHYVTSSQRDVKILASIGESALIIRNQIDDIKSILFFSLNPFKDRIFRKLFLSEDGANFLRGLLSEVRGSSVW